MSNAGASEKIAAMRKLLCVKLLPRCEKAFTGRYLRVAGKTRRHETSLEVRLQQRQLYYAQQQRVCRKRSPPRSSAVVLCQYKASRTF